MIDREFAQVLAKKFGSPLYVYDLEEVEYRAECLLSVLPVGSALLYSLKANPLPAIGMLLRKLGCGAEVSSAGELNAAFHAGFVASKILYTGPGKTEEEIREALSTGIIHFSCESWTDLARLELAAREFNAKAKVLIRINPSIPPKAQLAMCGVESQFGFEEVSLVDGAKRLESFRNNLEILGVHVYYGTQMSGNRRSYFYNTKCDSDCRTTFRTTRNVIRCC